MHYIKIIIFRKYDVLYFTLDCSQSEKCFSQSILSDIGKKNIVTLIIFLTCENFLCAFNIGNRILRMFWRLCRRKKTLEWNQRRGRQLHSYSLSKKKWVMLNIYQPCLIIRVFDRSIFVILSIDEIHLRYLLNKIHKFQITLISYF